MWTRRRTMLTAPERHSGGNFSRANERIHAEPHHDGAGARLAAAIPAASRCIFRGKIDAEFSVIFRNIKMTKVMPPPRVNKMSES